MNGIVWGNFAKRSPDQSKNMTWVYLSIQLELSFYYCVVIFRRFHFLCRICWELGMMFISSVKMAFSTNFISASCVKLNKFNFVIFFKKVTEFILIMFTVTFAGVNFPLCNKNLLLIYKWQDCLSWILLVLMVAECWIFVLGGKKGQYLIIDHLLSLSQWRYLHLTGVLNVTRCVFHIWESSQDSTWLLKNI